MAGDSVEVWLISAALPDALLAEFADLIDDAERERLDAILHPAERRRFLASHGAARRILAGIVGVPARQLSWTPGPNGKPRLRGEPTWPHVNLSHSGELCLLAVAGRDLGVEGRGVAGRDIGGRDVAGRDVGVDVQEMVPGLDPVAMANRRYPAAEAAFVAAGADRAGQLNRFVTLWARKEACVKAAAGKLMQGMGLPVAGASPVRVEQPGGPLPGRFVVTDIPVPDGYRAAVALTGEEPYDVAFHRWIPGVNMTAELEVNRDLAAPVERVWSAFTDPAALAAWFWPARFNTSVSTAKRVGGRYRIDGSAGGMAVSGEYLERQAPQRLAFTWRWDGDPDQTVVTIALRPAGEGTALALRHAGFADESTRDVHVQGWSDCLDRLPAWLASTA